MKAAASIITSSITLNELHDSLSPYLQEIISAKLKPHILHLSQYSNNALIKENWLSRYPILTYKCILYKKSKIFIDSSSTNDISIEKPCLLYADELIIDECFTNSMLNEMSHSLRTVRIKGPLIIFQQSYDCSLNDLQQLFELTEAQGFTFNEPYVNKGILSLAAISKMRKVFLSKLNVDMSYLSKLLDVEHLHIGGDELELKDITNLIRLLKYKENMQSYRISFKRNCLSLNDQLAILGDEAAGFIFPFMMLNDKAKMCSIDSIYLYRNCQIMFVVHRHFDNNDILIKFEEKEIFLISQAYTSSLIHGFKKHAI